MFDELCDTMHEEFDEFVEDANQYIEELKDQFGIFGDD